MVDTHHCKAPSEGFHVALLFPQAEPGFMVALGWGESRAHRALGASGLVPYTKQGVRCTSASALGKDATAFTERGFVFNRCKRVGVVVGNM